MTQLFNSSFCLFRIPFLGGLFLHSHAAVWVSHQHLAQSLIFYGAHVSHAGPSACWDVTVVESSRFPLLAHPAHLSGLLCMLLVFAERLRPLHRSSSHLFGYWEDVRRRASLPPCALLIPSLICPSPPASFSCRLSSSESTVTFTGVSSPFVPPLYFVWNLLSSWNISSNRIGKNKGTFYFKKIV